MSRRTARLVILNSAQEIAACAADIIVERAAEAIDRSGRFAIALSGGSTPKSLNSLLASDAFLHKIDWTKVIVFWGDERFVPPTESQSNFRMAQETLLAKVPVRLANIYAVITDGTPEEAAERYAQTLTTVLGPDVRFDLILLGLGDDGHTASLFPNHGEDPETESALVKVIRSSPKPPPTRISFTFNTINRAREILFLVSGAGKRQAVLGVFDKQSSIDQIPAKGVVPRDGNLVWLVDRAAYYGNA